MYEPIGEGGFRFRTGGRGHSAATVWYTILGSGSLSNAQPLMQASELSVNSAGHRFDRPGIGVNFRLLAAFGLSVGIIGRLQCLSRVSAAFSDQGEHRLVVQQLRVTDASGIPRLVTRPPTGVVPALRHPVHRDS